MQQKMYSQNLAMQPSAFFPRYSCSDEPLGTYGADTRVCVLQDSHHRRTQPEAAADIGKGSCRQGRVQDANRGQSWCLFLLLNILDDDADQVDDGHDQSPVHTRACPARPTMAHEHEGTRA